MQYSNSVPYYTNNMYNMSNINNNLRQPRPRPYPYQGYNNRLIGGGFLLPFSLGFLSSPLIFGATRPRPYPYYPAPGYYPYY